MTCQWCLNFRRKAGMPICASPERDGRTIPSRGGDSVVCEHFSPRISCTTCEYRCSPEEKYFLITNKSKCPKWKLRSLSTWGGSKYRGARMRISETDIPSQEEQKNEKENT